MTRLLPALALAALLAAPIAARAAPPASASDFAAMRKVMDDSAAAWSRGDLDGFMDAYERSDRTAFVTGKGVVRGFEPMKERYRKTYGEGAQLGHLAYSDLEADALGKDYAILFGRFHLQRPGAAKEDGGIFDLVMHKTPQGWRILTDHTS